MSWEILLVALRLPSASITFQTDSHFAFLGFLGINRNCLVFYLSNSIWWKGTEPIIGVTTDITVAVTTMCFDSVIISTFCLHGFSEDSASETAEWKVPFPAITM